MAGAETAAAGAEGVAGGGAVVAGEAAVEVAEEAAVGAEEACISRLGEAGAGIRKFLLVEYLPFIFMFNVALFLFNSLN